MSRRLLATRIAQARAPIAAAAEHGVGADVLGLHVCRPDDGDQPEEHEHEHLAEAAVAVGVRPAGVEPRRDDGGGADQQQPPAGGRSEHEPGHGRDAERRERRGLDLRRAGQARADEPQRADPVGVGAADPVGVVVGVVDADLQRQRHDERQQRLPPDERVGVRPPTRCPRAPVRPPPEGCAAGLPRSTGRWSAAAAWRLQGSASWRGQSATTTADDRSAPGPSTTARVVYLPPPDRVPVVVFRRDSRAGDAVPAPVDG